MLLERTDGWPAALRLAGLSLAGRSDSADAVTRLTSDDLTIADYLFSEALARQPRYPRKGRCRDRNTTTAPSPTCCSQR